MPAVMALTGKGLVTRLGIDLTRCQAYAACRLANISSDRTRVATRHQVVARDRTRRRGAVRLVVDLNRCQGFAQCVFLAPDVFELHGEEALRYDPNPGDDLRLRVLRAAAACPVQAILVERLDEEGAVGTA